MSDDDLLTAISKLENSMLLVENLIQNIYVLELPEGNLIMNLRFNQSKDYDAKLVGGLTATIQEFAGSDQSNEIKSISLEELNLLFVAHKKFLVVFSVDPAYPDEQFIDVIEAFVGGFDVCLMKQEYGSTIDGAAVSIQTMQNLISEEIHMEVQLGSKVTIYPFKLRELAEKTAERVYGVKKEKSSSKDLYDDTEVQTETKTTSEPSSSPEQAMNKLLKQFTNSFKDVNEITLVRTTILGEFEKHSESKLEDNISNDIYENVMGMIDTVSHLIDQDIEYRTIDLEDNGQILFQKVTDFSFLYIVVEAGSSLENLEPIIERIGTSINKLFPDDM